MSYTDKKLRLELSFQVGTYVTTVYSICIVLLNYSTHTVIHTFRSINFFFLDLPSTQSIFTEKYLYYFKFNEIRVSSVITVK